MRKVIYPSNEIETTLESTKTIVCGIDEVGRGAWAGPLVMACIIPGDGTVEGVRDSKKIPSKKREELSEKIHAWAKGVGIGIVSNDEIDEIGMVRALRECALRSIHDVSNKCETKPDHILLDGHYDFIKSQEHKTTTVIKGDDKSHVIAASSIVAKVFRDALMSTEQVRKKYPQYFFESNKGYPSQVHKDALKQYGATDLHRVSWNIFGQDSHNDSTQALF